MKIENKVKQFSVLLTALLLPATAMAHEAVTQMGGVMHGLMHPLVGMDHMVAMLAVGGWALYVGGRAVWLLPLTFVVLMLAGAGLMLNGYFLPGVETMIMLSVVILGALIAMGVKMPVIAGTVLVGTFGIFHGFAHGAELLNPTVALGYGVGFASSTALLHLAGIGLAARLFKQRPFYLKIAGGLVMGSGLIMGMI